MILSPLECRCVCSVLTCCLSHVVVVGDTSLKETVGKLEVLCN